MAGYLNIGSGAAKTADKSARDENSSSNEWRRGFFRGCGNSEGSRSRTRRLYDAALGSASGHQCGRERRTVAISLLFVGRRLRRAARCGRAWLSVLRVESRARLRARCGATVCVELLEWRDADSVRCVQQPIEVCVAGSAGGEFGL